MGNHKLRDTRMADCVSNWSAKLVVSSIKMDTAKEDPIKNE